MADLQKTVEIVFGGRNDLSKTIGEVERSLSNINNATQPFADIATAIGGITLAADTAILALGGFSVDAAGSFQTGMNEIKTLLDTRVVDFDDFSNQVRGFFSTTAQPIDEVLSATYQSISQGIPPEAIGNFLSSVDILATAGGSTLPAAVNLLAGTANAYGLSIDDVSGYADIFFTAVKDGKTTIPDLASAIGTVTSLAAPFGVSVADVAAAIAALTSYGVPTTEQAATILKNMIQGLVNPSASAAKSAKDLGISLGADIFRDKTLPEVLNDIGEKTGFSAGKIQDMFTSTEALQGVLPLINDPAQKFKKAIDDMSTSTGSAQKAYDDMVGSYDNLNGRMVNSIKDVLISIGIPLLDDYANAIKGLDGIFDAINLGLSSGSFDPIIAVFEDLLEDVGQFARDIAAALPDALENVDWSGLIKSFDDVETSLSSVFDAIFGPDAGFGNADELGKTIQVFVDGLAGLNNLSAGIIEALPGLLSAISDFIRGATTTDAETLLNIGKGLGALVAINVVSGAASGLVTMVGGLSLALANLTKINPAAIAGVAAALGPIALIAGSGYAFGTWLNGQINTAVQSLTGGENDSLGGLIYDWINGDSSKIDAAMTTVESQLQRPISKIEDDLTPAARAFVDKVRGNAEDFSAIQWELDPQGNILGTVTTLATETDAKFQELKGYYESLGNSPKIAAAMAQLELQTQRIPSAVSKAKDDTKVKAEELLVELEKIASNERLKTFEISAELNIANLEAESKKAIAIIDGIGTSITSTGDLLGNLTGSFGDLSPTDLAARRTIDDLIDDENKRRDEVFKQQKELTKVQIDLENEKLSRLQNGDAIIKISGDGLAPELEAFMWKILERIQIEAAADQAEFLLGV